MISANTESDYCRPEYNSYRRKIEDINPADSSIRSSGLIGNQQIIIAIENSVTSISNSQNGCTLKSLL
jgi:hypothetical protein